MRSDAQSLANGTRIGPYRIDSLLGKGGMGEVYVAHEERLNRKVALKIIAIAGSQEKKGRAKQEALRRFILEAKTLAKINHPNVVTIFAIEEIDDRHVIAMEFVEGPTLRQVLDSYAFGASEAAPLFLQMLEGLRSLHENRVLHRDLKPQNMVLRANGQIKILDFGIAKDGDNDLESTVAGAFVGTVNYLAPDVAAGEAASERSDLWSLGAIFYEMLVGRKLIQPPQPDNFLAAIEYIKDLHVSFPPECEAWAPLEIQGIIAKLCANLAKDRYASAAEAVEDLRMFSSSRLPVREKFYETVVRDVEGALALRKRIETQGFSVSAMKRIMAMSALKQFELGDYPEVAGPFKAGEENASFRVAHGLVSKSILEFESGKLRIQTNDTSAFGLEPRTLPPPPPPASPDSTQSRFANSQSYAQSYAHSNGRMQARSRRFVRELAVGGGLLLLLVIGLVFFLKRTPPMTEEERRASTPHLVEPLAKTIAWLDPKQIATFRWLPAFEVGQYEIELASDAGFEKIVLREGVYGTQFRPGRILPEGVYYWRLRSLKESSVLGPANFTLAYFGPPELQVPPANARIETAAGREGAEADFAWSCKLGATSYHLQVAVNGTTPAVASQPFAKTAVDRVTSECGVKSVTLAPGSYLWRVQVEEPGMASGRWSPTARLDVSAPSALLAVHKSEPVAVKLAEVPAPKTLAKTPLSLTNPKSRVTLQFALTRGPASVANPPVLEWASVSGARLYELQLSKSPEFRKIVAEQKSGAMSFAWKNAAPGRYFWRVRALNASGSLLAESDVGELRVSLPAPVLKARYSLSQSAKSVKEGGESLDIRFEKIPLAEQYLIQWSREASFGVMRETLASVPGARLRLRDPGLYYVRASAVDVDREPASAFSQPSVIDLAPKLGLASPQPAVPIAGSKVVAGKGSLHLEFAWSKVTGADGYQLEISREETFTVVFKTLKSAAPKTTFRESIPAGRVFWRVKALRRGESSAWSEVSSFDLQK